MPYFALLYETVDDFIERRTTYRDEHLRQVRGAHARGEIRFAGALGNPPDGALLIFLADDARTAETFARTDPYVKNGLVTRWNVRPWSVVVGSEESRAKSPGND